MTVKLLNELYRLQTRWKNELPSPVWYLSVIPEMQIWLEGVLHETVDVQERCKKQLYDFFEQQLVQSNIGLGLERHLFDAERKPVDTVVIHHTSNPPGMSADRLSAIELLRLYAPYFVHPTSARDEQIKGGPISSGHERDGIQVFWPYHWIIRKNGVAERLLQDEEIGWHAGNWDVNCRSVAIVLDNDYEWRRPSSVELRSIASIILTHYPQVTRDRILGHREVNPKTTCPSNLFLEGQSPGWKAGVLGYLTAKRQAA